MTEVERGPSVRITGAQRWLETRLANPLLRWLLRSPLHGLASRWLVLFAYTGRRSGRRYAIPALGVRAGDAVVVATPRHESNWWRNFREGAPATVWWRGRRYPATGQLLDPTDDDPALEAYLARYGWVWRGLAGEDLDRAREELAAVRFDLSSPGGSA